MTLAWLALLALCLLASGIFSGGETGLYSLSRLRVRTEAEHGQRAALIIQRLLRDEAMLLVTLLVANNLVNQVAIHVGRQVLAPFGVPARAEELVLTLLLTPPLFVLGELFPKDFFRRRPHFLVGRCAPVIALAKGFLLPLTWPLRALAVFSARVLGLEAGELARVQGREAVLELLREREATLEPHMESMARNVLELRSLRAERVMVPWRRVETLQRDAPPAAVRTALRRTDYTRLPVVGPQGAVLGYVHQLEVLAAGEGARAADHLRPMIALPPSTPLDRALARLRASGQRAALVGTPERPLGLVTLKDLLEEISGELHRW